MNRMVSISNSLVHQLKKRFRVAIVLDKNDRWIDENSESQKIKDTGINSPSFILDATELIEQES